MIEFRNNKMYLEPTQCSRTSELNFPKQMDYLTWNHPNRQLSNEDSKRKVYKTKSKSLHELKQMFFENTRCLIVPED